MQKKAKSFALGLFLALVGAVCLLLNAAHARAESDYEPFDGDGWSITADGVMTIESNQGWANCLKHGFKGDPWKLVLGKDVTRFRMYSLPYDLPTEDFFGKEDIIGRDQYGNVYYDYPFFWGLFPSKIVVEEGNSVFQVVDGLLINTDTKELVLSEMDVRDVVIPEGIQSITREAFFKRPLHSVQVPESVKRIGPDAFFKCELLTNVQLPDTLEQIETGAFSGCSALEQITLPHALQQIDAYAFEDSALKAVDIPINVQEVGPWAFFQCEQLEKVILPDGIDKINVSAFGMCKNLVEVNFPEGLTSIGENAFSLCRSIKRVILPSSLQEIGNNAFGSCKLSILQIPSKLDFLVFTDEKRGYIINPHSKRDKCFGAYSVETVIFAGSDYDFGYPAITDAKNVYFLSTPPEDVGQILDKDSVGNIYCSDEFEYQWTRSSVASWVRQKLTILPAAEIKAIAEEAVNATPEPIVTPSPTPTPLPTETPWPTPIITPRATPRQEAPAEAEPVDPILFVFAGVIVGVIVGIVLISQQAKKTKRRSRSKK